MTAPPALPDDILELGDAPVLAKGAVRDVFERPGHPAQLLKVFQAWKQRDVLAPRGVKGFLGRVRPLGPYLGLLREYRSYLRAAYRAEREGRPVPVAEIGAVIRTDRGLAQVVEKVTDGGGGLAPNIKKIAQRKMLDATKLDRLNLFVRDVYALEVNVPDLTVQNVVWDALGMRFVLIDGLGDKTLLPLREWIPALNKRQIDARFSRIGALPGLAWDATSRRFTLEGGQGDQAGQLVSEPSDGILSLAGETPIANGKFHDIYLRPGRPDWILKVSRPHRRKARDARRGPLRSLKRRFGLGPYKAILREYECYLLTARRAERLNLSIPIAEIGGVLRTDQGLASVMRRIIGPTGDLAPTLGELVRSDSLDDRALSALNVFVATIRALDLVLADFHAGNLLHVADQNRFVLVDGFGKGGFLRPRKHIRAINQRHLDRQCAALAVGTSVRWNGAIRRYERA